MSTKFNSPDDDNDRAQRRANREKRRQPSSKMPNLDEDGRRPGQQKPRRENRNYRDLLYDEDDE